MSAPSPAVRQALLANLAPSLKQEARPLLLEALADKEPFTGISAAGSLVRLQMFNKVGLGDKEYADALALLISRLASPDPTTAGAAGCALFLLWNPDVDQAVRQALTASDLWARVRAADLLRKKKLAFDVTVLAQPLERGSEDIQLYACGTLARMQTEPCVALANAALRSPHAPVRQSAVYALEVTTFPSAVEALGRRSRRARTPTSGTRAATVLGRRTDSEPILAALRAAAAKDADASVRDAARIAAAVTAKEDLSTVLADRQKFFADAAKLQPRESLPVAGDLPRSGRNRRGRGTEATVGGRPGDREPGGARRQMHSFTKDPNNPVMEQQFPWKRMGANGYCTTPHYDPQTRVFSFWYTSLAEWRRQAKRSRTVRSAWRTARTASTGCGPTLEHTSSRAPRPTTSPATLPA